MSSLSRRAMLKNLGVTGLLLAGNGTTAATRSGGVTAGDTRFRVGHFSPDAPPVDVYVNGDPFPGLQGVPFGTLSDYFTIPAGACQVGVTPADDASAVVIGAGVTFRCSHDYTVVAADVLDAIIPVTLTDTNRPAPHGKASVCVMHSSPDTPEVDVVVKDGPTLFSGLAFGGASQCETMSAGTYDLQVVPSLNEAAMLNLPGTTLPGGRAISVFTIGFATDESPGFNVLPVVDAVSSTRKPEPPSDGDACRVG